jgi:hypothetical protein
MAEALLARCYGAAGVQRCVSAFGAGWCYAPGASPLLLVAHTDTVHRAPPSVLYHDPKESVVWAPEGLGADDRAGVYAIAAVLGAGLRPHVLLTDGEEIGGRGASAAAADLPPPPVHYMVQLDRAGASDAVYYQHQPRRAERRYFARRGFQRAYGTYTDIVELMPAWQIAGVNLSVGYYLQHSKAEHLRLGELCRTIDAVCRMVASPPPPCPYRGERVREAVRDIRSLAADDLGLGADLDYDPTDYDPTDYGAADRCDGCCDSAALEPSVYRSGMYCDDCRAVLADAYRHRGASREVR